ncbi:MAG: hypothetical protein IKE76_14880 [Clostridia bacterium]|nr:hypothetical protein [Clostridia bacterium]
MTVATPKAAQAAPAKPAATAATTGTDAAASATVTVTDPVAGLQYVALPKGQQPGEYDWATAGQTHSAGDLAFTGLTPGADYVVYARMPETATANASAPSKPAAVTAPKGEQSAPDAPVIKAVVTTGIDTNSSDPYKSSIEIDPREGEAYSIDGGATWITPNESGRVVFDNGKKGDGESFGLSPAQTYEIVARRIGTEALKPSAPGAAARVTTPSRSPSAKANTPVIVATTPGSITVQGIPGEAYIVMPEGHEPTADDWTHAQSVAATEAGPVATVFMQDTEGYDIQRNAKYVVYSRVTATDVTCAKPATTTTPKAENSNNAPDAPTVAGTTANSITVNAVNGQVYSIDGGVTWAEPAEGEHTVTFDGLTPNKTYEIVTRLAATGTTKPGRTSPATSVTTAKADQAAPEAPVILVTTPTTVTV